MRTDRIKYDLELYLRELSELLFHLGVQEPFHLIGSSMGAIVSSEYALRNPGSVKKIVLSGPAGFDLEASGSGLEKNRYVRRFMPEVIKQMLIMRQNRKYFYEPWRFEEFLLTYKQQLEIKGSTDAILSTLVFSPVQSYERRYMDLARMNVPVLIVWGKEDVAFPFENSAKLRLAIPRAEFLPVEKAAHLPQYEQPAVTNQRYSEFLTNR